MTETLDSPTLVSGGNPARTRGASAVDALLERCCAPMDEPPEASSKRCLHPDRRPGGADSLSKHLSGWFGGSTLHLHERDHAWLRMQPAPCAISAIDALRRDEWMLCMPPSRPPIQESRTMKPSPILAPGLVLAGQALGTEAASRARMCDAAGDIALAGHDRTVLGPVVSTLPIGPC